MTTAAAAVYTTKRQAKEDRLGPYLVEARSSFHRPADCVELWRAVLRQALQDVRADVAGFAGRLKEPGLSHKQLNLRIKEHVQARQAVAGAVAWFTSDDRDVGSFLWVCDQVDREADDVRREALSGRA